VATSWSGWTEAAFAFYRALELDNTNAFWERHRATFEAEVRSPFEALVPLVDEFGPLRMARPHRDTRFSKDRSPYKTRGYAVAPGPAGESFYVEVSADGVVAGAGYWMMAPDQLARYRAAVDDQQAGAALDAVVAGLRADGFELAGHQLRSAPRGVAKDHPRLELLRFKSLAAMRRASPPAWAAVDDPLAWLTGVWAAAAPLDRWLVDHVGPTTATTAASPPGQGTARRPAGRSGRR
jgi:uncharacterized protein (TIGR02453 family)